MSGHVLEVVLVLAAVSIASASKCSVENRTSDLGACLEAIQHTYFDQDRFWFGRQYNTLCPGGFADGLPCMNARPNFNDSLGTRLFNDMTYAPQLDRYLSLTYESITRNYSGCGVTYRSNGNIWRQEIDPLSMDVQEPWYLRNRPVMEWSHSAGELFTLIVFDVGNAFVHGIYANIEGNDLSTAYAPKPYSGPLASTNIPNAYIFILYNHSEPVNITDSVLNTFLNSWQPFSLQTFVAALGFTGPVAMNYLTARGDIYSSVTMYTRIQRFTCPIYATRAMRMKPRPFLPNDTALTIWIDVTFTTPAISYTACCQDVIYQADTFDLNPIQNPVYKTEAVRTEASLHFVMKKIGWVADYMNFTNELYTMIIVDPDVPFDTAGTEEKPLLHGLYANIMDGNVSTADVGMAYGGPSPPDNTVHWYYFLLYKHTDPVNTTELLGYNTGACSRCLYDINAAVADNNLELVGATWLTAETDDYVIYRRVSDDPTLEEGYCTGKAGYTVDCVGINVLSNANIVIFSKSVLFAIFVVMLFILRH